MLGPWVRRAMNLTRISYLVSDGEFADYEIFPYDNVPNISNISVSPTSNDFGSVKIGIPSTPETFTIKNYGNADLDVGTISVTGTDASDFSIQNDNSSGQTITTGRRENRNSPPGLRPPGSNQYHDSHGQGPDHAIALPPVR